MSIFDPAYFLRHIGMPTLRLFVEHHPVRELLDIDWNQEECSLPSRISKSALADFAHSPSNNVLPSSFGSSRSISLQRKAVASV